MGKKSAVDINKQAVNDKNIFNCNLCTSINRINLKALVFIIIIHLIKKKLVEFWSLFKSYIQLWSDSLLIKAESKCHSLVLILILVPIKTRSYNSFGSKLPNHHQPNQLNLALYCTNY